MAFDLHIVLQASCCNMGMLTIFLSSSWVNGLNALNLHADGALETEHAGHSLSILSNAKC